MSQAKRELFIGVIGFLFIGTLLCAPNAVAQEFDAEPTVSANFDRGITVTGHHGKAVSVQERGRTAIQQRSRTNRPLRFTDLRAGRVHIVRVDGRRIARLIPVRRTHPITDLAFEALDRPNTVRVTWQHKRTRATGGKGIHYLLTATSTTSQTISQQVKNPLGSEVHGLDPHARYTFEIVAVNSIGVGPVASVTMQRSLQEMLEPPSVESPAPLPPPAPIESPVQDPPGPTPAAPLPSSVPQPIVPEPAPAPEPEPEPEPVFVCPDGFDDVDGVCTRTSPYEYEYQDYTFTVQPLRIESYEDICSEAGLDDNGNLIWIVEPYECTLTRVIFGPVQDPVPDGWEDTGTQWSRVAPPPDGWTDNGTEYEQTVEKVPQAT